MVGSSWSGFAEFARQWILVSRNKAYDPMTGDQHIKMVVGSYGHGGEYDIHVREGVFPDRRWDVEMMDLNGIVGSAVKPSVSQRKAKGRRQRILDTLSTATEPMTKNRLVQITGVNNAHVSEALDELRKCTLCRKPVPSGCPCT